VDGSFEAGTKQVLLNRVRQAEGMGSPGHENLSGWSMAQTLSMCVSCHWFTPIDTKAASIVAQIWIANVNRGGILQ